MSTRDFHRLPRLPARLLSLAGILPLLVAPAPLGRAVPPSNMLDNKRQVAPAASAVGRRQEALRLLVSPVAGRVGAVLVSPGQRVTAGTVLMRLHDAAAQAVVVAARARWSTGPHLFFEVRQNGRPVDPLGR